MFISYENRLLWALEKGSKKEIDSVFKDSIDSILPTSFTAYMDIIINKKDMRRQDIAQKANLSRSYSYKLLTGEKHTKERDKIILLRMALEMTLDEVQTALDLYPFPRLNTHFKRDTLISIAINNKKSIDELDEWLSITDLPLLSLSKTEDLDIFPPNRSTKKSKDKVYSNHRETNYQERSIPMEVLNERCASTLMCDGIYAYDAEIAIRNDENKIVYLHANYSYGDHFTVADASIYDWITTESDEEPNVTFIEEYEKHLKN